MVGVAVIGAGNWGRNHVRVFNEMLEAGKAGANPVNQAEGEASEDASTGDEAAVTASPGTCQ